MAPGGADDAAFFSLELPSWTPAPTTPAMADDERGLRIAAPKQVILGDDVRLPISVIASFDGDVRNALPARLWPHLLAVVQDGQGRQLAAHPLGDTTPISGERDPAPLPPEPVPMPPAATPGATTKAQAMPDVPFPLQPEGAPSDAPRGSAPVLQASSSIGYYNFDLLEVVDLPRVAGAEYVIFLSYARFHSNSVRVRFVPPGR
jgi:hypothetical protein